MQIPDWLRRWGPVMLGALAIWTFSTEYFSDVRTGRVVVPALHWMFPWMTPRMLHLGNKAVRKLAHLAVYFVFGLLLFRAVRGEQKGWQWKWAAGAVALAAACAALDEFHQWFVPLRHPSIRDVCLDTFGALAAQVAVWRYGRRSEKGGSAPPREQDAGG
jgi:VanZ family protein